jgi:DNA repair protein RadD
MALAFDQSELVSESVSEIIKLAEGRKGILAFCSSVEHARNVCAEFRNRGQQCEMICGETPSDERAKILADFQAQRLRIVTNCNVLTFLSKNCIERSVSLAKMNNKSMT